MSPSIAIAPPHSLYSHRVAGLGKHLAVGRLRPSGLASLQHTGNSPDATSYQADAEVTRYGRVTGEVSRQSLGDAAKHPNHHRGDGTWAHVCHRDLLRRGQ